MRSLLWYGGAGAGAGAGFTVIFRTAWLMLFTTSVLPPTVSFNSVCTCCMISATSNLNCCWMVTKSAHVISEVSCFDVSFPILQGLDRSSLTVLHAPGAFVAMFCIAVSML